MTRTSTTDQSAAQEIEALRAELRHHEELYYVYDKPEISDADDDALLARLQALEAEHPELLTPDSPTQRVGGRPAEKFEQYAHRRPLLSLDNSYNIEDLRAFDERCRKLADGRAFEYVAELKIDGLSIAAHYEDGLLVRGVTRGDGRVGEDVTQNVRTIRSVPLRLKVKEGGAEEVRGEAYLSRKAFERINAEREELDEQKFANPRNAAAGTIRQLDPKIVSRRRLDLFAYDVLRGERKPFATHWEALDWLEAAGFSVNPHRPRRSSVEEGIAVCKHMEAERDRLEY